MKYINSNLIPLIYLYSVISFTSCSHNCTLATHEASPSNIEYSPGPPYKYNLKQVTITLKKISGSDIIRSNYKPVTVTIFGDGKGIVEHILGSKVQRDGKIIDMRDYTREFTIGKLQYEDLLNRFYNSDIL